MNTKRTVHLIGIGGIGMSGIARLFLSQGWNVQGTDAKASGVTEALEAAGARIWVGHEARFVEGADLVVYSSSIQPGHPERLEAQRRGLETRHRSEALARFTEGKFLIAVSGTHGKTTTTGLIGAVLREAGLDPTVVVGGWVPDFGCNVLLGNGRPMVIEADESDSSFLNYEPDIEVITNIEDDHMDHFRSMAGVEDAFKAFVRRLKPTGLWFGCSEDERVLRLAGQMGRACSLYGGGPGADFRAEAIVECPGGRRGVSFVVTHEGRTLGPIVMNLVGRHNVLNALAAVGIGIKLGVPFASIQKGLESFRGTGRRFDVQFEDDDIMVVDDYAHHPTEIRSTLAAARSLGKKRIVALFQPHRYTRTEALLDQFGPSFRDADRLIVTDIYAASEAPIPGVTAERLRSEIERQGHPNVSFLKRPLLSNAMFEEVRPGDLVISLGAGDIHQVAKDLAHFLRTKTLRSGTNGGASPLVAIRGRVLEQEPLSRHTTLKVGGPARYWVEPADAEDLRKVLEVCRADGTPVYIVGAGSNILAPDEGLEGAVIHLRSPYFSRIEEGADGRLVVGAGALNTEFIQYAVDHGYGGVEYLAGIPGSLGGAIVMNAGSHGQSIDQVVESVGVMGLDGREFRLERRDIPFRYRHSGIREGIVMDAVLRLPRVPREEVQSRLDEYRDYRWRTQDLRHPSAGCMFKNPVQSGCSSGKLIEDAGLKGFRIGNAQVSSKHANFIINLGGASAFEVRRLMDEVRRVVKDKFNVDLESEVRSL